MLRKNIILLLLISQYSLGQTVDAEYLNPGFNDVGNYKFLRFGNTTTFYGGFMWNDANASYGNGNDFSIFTYENRDITLRTGLGNVIVFPSSGGNMGIGTTSPNSKLSIYLPNSTSTYPTNTVKGDVLQTITSSNNGLEFGNGRSLNDRKAWILARHSQTASYGKYYSVLHLQPDVGDKSQYKGVAIGYNASDNLPVGTHLAINGNVGIGTTSPDAKLAVNGNIHAKEVKVDLVGWPDYVFKEDYDLPTLEEVEKHIKEKGHLINIPSAKEVEQNGVELGKMNKLLLEKIEELTLYTLKQEKEIDRLRSLEQNYALLSEKMKSMEQSLKKINALKK